jgi:predicted MarR family transcription regulator
VTPLMTRFAHLAHWLVHTLSTARLPLLSVLDLMMMHRIVQRPSTNGYGGIAGDE